ncbi:probable 1-deoxy-D-xylulose-5-phosphate synthase, chloroplastic isoform X2 [Syzygium oleosum]|uniref:probable 1-deoxy-D-xylulose-5-phosphate synthase, chloroplastic isoform X2 n=1 Tax=Syzygium oleosum TaxID=219896 RepID=UPI0024BA462E|nr:probable 1-deoxy-D-xylulose-5-phosphate synthase, chloroplastic isoform X2 [Syzygium oleosum]
MAAASARFSAFGACGNHGERRPSCSGSSKVESWGCRFSPTAEVCKIAPASGTTRSKNVFSQINSLPDDDDFFYEKVPTPMLDVIESPTNVKNLSTKELRQLADEIRLELSSILSKAQKPLKASLAVVELTVAIHHVFHAPADKILWDIGEQTYAHKMLTGRRSLMNTLRQKDGLSGFTSRSESEYDPFGAGHGCSSISAGLGMAVARDMKGKRERILTVISNGTTMAGQVYEAMSNAGYLDSDMIVILNDSRHSLHPNVEEGPKTSINALSSTLSKLQSSKSFRKFREVAKGVTKKIGRGMHEWAAKVDEFARGMMGPPGATLFEELGLYYIGPIDGHNIEDLVCVFQEVVSLNSMGPVLIHVVTEENQGIEHSQRSEIDENLGEGSSSYDSVASNYQPRTYSDCFVEALVRKAESDKDVVMVHGGVEVEPSLQLFREKFPDKFFDVGMAEQHAVTFSAGLSCGGLKPFCVIPSTFLQRAFDQVVHDVDRQRIPVRFVITSAGLVGSNGPVQCGAFDITFMSCLPNMIVMAPSDEDELVDMVETAAMVDDRPICFRYPRGAIVRTDKSLSHGIPIESRLEEGEFLQKVKMLLCLVMGQWFRTASKLGPFFQSSELR